MQDNNATKYLFMGQDRPVLTAELTGGGSYPDVRGTVQVYELPEGIYLQGDIEGLPLTHDLAFYVHDGATCEEIGKKLLTLPDVMSGDDGRASASVMLDRVSSTQIAGRPIVLQFKSDGQTAACGILARIL